MGKKELQKLLVKQVKEGIEFTETKKKAIERFKKLNTAARNLGVPQEKPKA